MISFDDIGQVCVSFHCDNEIAPGSPCSVYRSQTVGFAKANEPFIGKVISYRNNVANVVISGFVTFPYSGSPVSVGYTNLCSDGEGNITANEDGKTYLVVAVDNFKKTATILL